MQETGQNRIWFYRNNISISKYFSCDLAGTSMVVRVDTAKDDPWQSNAVIIKACGKHIWWTCATPAPLCLHYRRWEWETILSMCWFPWTRAPLLSSCSGSCVELIRREQSPPLSMMMIHGAGLTRCSKLCGSPWALINICNSVGIESWLRALDWNSSGWWEIYLEDTE